MLSYAMYSFLLSSDNREDEDKITSVEEEEEEKRKRKKPFVLITIFCSSLLCYMYGQVYGISTHLLFLGGCI